jgi:hypothetical protein
LLKSESLFWYQGKDPKRLYAHTRLQAFKSSSVNPCALNIKLVH